MGLTKGKVYKRNSIQRGTGARSYKEKKQGKETGGPENKGMQAGKQP